jgi:glycine cleavage system H lipoate-binding protein
MTCPFLKEAQVKYCRTAAVRKLIPLAQAGRSEDKCSGPDHHSCPVYRAQPDDGDASGPCPYLCESLMQYCSAAPVSKFVPYSESLLSRCGNDAFRYCELYLRMAHPALPSEDVDGIPLPGWLAYSANHLWLDVTDDGVCHAGIDGFLARALGTVDRISYIWQKGRHRPAAVLSSGGMDVEVTFPNPLLLTACNLYLRANPARIVSDPYTSWLFEGAPSAETEHGLMRGPEARRWMEQEERRMNEFLQRQTKPGGATAADGGQFAPGVTHQIERDGALALVHEFFSPYARDKEEL